MSIVSPAWVRWLLRIVGWVIWQSFCALWALVLFANLFGEYGRFDNRYITPAAAVAFLGAALWLGSWIPVRSWTRSERAKRPRGHIVMKMHAGILLLAATALSTAGCADNGPLASFDACTLGPVESVRRGSERVEVACELDHDYVLLGVPNRRATADELIRVGVSNDIAEAISRSDSTGDRWCAIEEFDVPPRKKTDGDSSIPTARIECRSTHIKIPEIVQAHGATVTFTLTRNSSGAVMLSRFEGRVLHGTGAR